ncbi:MAG: M15 family metallopeptidase [Bdellovibrionales bacterium]|nr:M15 family metallopeptidase [Bdellovibrionales bacterium]
MDLSKILTGQSEEHVVPWRDTHSLLHPGVCDSLEDMAQAARVQGLEITVASAFRSFDRQLGIWNAKACGQRPLFDDYGTALDVSRLSEDEIIHRILRWSALPGMSRHHWGTDLDIYDSAAVPADYKLQLTGEESRTHFARLHAWLDVHMEQFGFFRPYARDLGGIAPEPWHISYGPLAKPFFAAYPIDLLHNTLSAAPIALKERVLADLPQIFERYFKRITD